MVYRSGRLVSIKNTIHNRRRVTYQLELFDDLGRLIYAQYCTGSRNTESGVGGREGLETCETRIGGTQGAVEGTEAVHVLRSILQHPVSRPRIRDGVDGKRLESAPAEGEDEGISRLENLLVPTVLLDSNLHKAESVLRGRKTSDNDRHPWLKVLDELCWDTLDDHPGVLAGLVAFDSDPLAFIKILVFRLVDVELLLDHGLLGIIPVVLSKLIIIATFSPGNRLVVLETFTIFLFEAKLELLLSAGVLLTLGFKAFCWLLLSFLFFFFFFFILVVGAVLLPCLKILKSTVTFVVLVLVIKTLEIRTIFALTLSVVK